MARSLNQQMDLFERVDPVEIPDLDTPPFSPELLAESKEKVEKAPLDFVEGSITAPFVAAGDIVDLGAAAPPLSDKQMMMPGAVQYSAIEQLFETLSNQGVSRDSAVKLINENTPVNLEGSPAEFIGEMAGVTATGVAKAVSGLAKIASKYGDDAGKYLSEIGGELGEMFNRSTPGGDDFDGMAPATVADTPPVAAQTDQAFDAAPTVPDTSVSPIMIGTSTGAGRQAADDYDTMKAANPDMDEAELFAQTGVYKGPDGQHRLEVDTTDAKLAVDVQNLLPGDTISLGSLLDFEDLFNAYEKSFYDNVNLDFRTPESLRNVEVHIVDDPDFNGTYSYTSGDIQINADLLKKPENFRSTLLHEVQHAVQHREGFVSGSSSEAFISSSAKAIDPTESLGPINSMDDLVKLADKNKKDRVSLNNNIDVILKNHIEGVLGSPSLTPNLKYEKVDELSTNTITDVILAALQREGVSMQDIKGGVADNAFKSKNIREFLQELKDVNKKQNPTERQQSRLDDIDYAINLIDKLDAAGDADAVLRKTILPKVLNAAEGSNLRQIEAVADLSYYRKYGEVESRLIQERDARRAQLRDMGFDRREIFSILREEFPPENYTVPLEVMTAANVDVSNLKQATLRRPGNKGAPAFVLPESDVLLEGAERRPEGLGVADDVAGEKKSRPALPEKMQRGFVDAAIEGRRQASENAVKMFAEDGALDAFKVGDRIPGKNTSFKVTGYSAQGFSKEAMEKQIDQYQRLRKDQIEAGTVPEQPTYMLGDDDKYYRLVINVEGDDGTVTQLSHDILTHQNKKFDKFLGKLNMAEGGVVPMDKQMDMFADGGLEQDGGTNDPVSGNEVPPGSTQEEVRDDIPAQLSEGEFVFPADVVRYIGLGNLMRMRQEAKMGLKLMDQMGQMGNSEEATMPDDLPFDINDLDMDDEEEYNSSSDDLEMQVGGFVPAQQQQQQQFGIAGYTPAQQPTTGFAQQPVLAASQQFVQPTTPVAQAPTPTMQQYEVPQFSDFVGGGFGEYDELREYRNEAGQVMMIPFKDGNPISPIPEGYTFYDPEETATEEVTTTPTTPQTTQVREESGDDDPGPKYSTTDVSGIGYDRSKLEPELREVISEFGFGLGALGEAFNIYSNVASALSKDPRVKDSSLTSAALGGVLDAYRGGNVTFSDPNRMGRKTGQYDINTPLHEMTPGMQLDIAAVARSVVKDMRDIFVDKDGKPKTVSEVDRSLKTAAAGLGVDVTIPGTNITKSRTTVIREIAEARADRDRERIEKERREAQIQQIIEDTGDTGETTGTGGAPASTFYSAGEQSIQDLLASASDDGPLPDLSSVSVPSSSGSSRDVSRSESDRQDPRGESAFGGGFRAKGGLIDKPKPKTKKMKRGGLASKK